VKVEPFWKQVPRVSYEPEVIKRRFRDSVNPSIARQRRKHGARL
jgi:hypothetical protein